MYTISGVTDHIVKGNEMAGLRLTVQFSDGSTSEAVWEDFAPGSDYGFAQGTGFYVDQAGDTFGNAVSELWYIYNDTSDKNILTLTLEGQWEWDVANVTVAFDLLGTRVFTPGSEYGKINLAGDGANRIAASYRATNNIYFDGAETRDLYATLTIDFSDGAGGAGLTPYTDDPTTSSFAFYLDTDLVQGSIVPLPGGFLLLASGLLCLIGIRRRTPETWRYKKGTH